MKKSLISLWFIAVLICLFSLATPTYTYAQTTDGTMAGKVFDTSGAVISGATVKVTNDATGYAVNLPSDGQGGFRFEHLPTGNYTIEVTADGFAPAMSKITVILGQVTDATIKLQVGSDTTVVDVNGSSEVLVETSTSTLSSSFDSRRVEELPTSTGSELELALLSPNVSTQGGGVAGDGGSVGGQRPRNNSFTLDGVDNNDAIVTGHVINVIPEAVGEFTILTNQYSAEYGHSSAGQFNTVTKTGSNEFHGGSAFVNNNKNYNAVDHLTKEAIASGSLPDQKPRFDQNRLSFNLGGPIIKNKLFFFGAYQYNNFGGAGSATTFGAPTAAGLGVLSTLKGVSPFTLGLFNQYALPAATADLGTVQVLGKNIPVGTASLLIPSFLTAQTFNVNIDQATSKGDQFRYRYNYSRTSNPNVGVNNPIFTGSTVSLNQLASFTYIKAIKPTLLNEFRFSYRRQFQQFGIPTQFQNFPNIEIDDLGFAIGPEGNSPQGGVANSYQYVDNITYTRGRNTFKGGIEFRNTINPQSFLPRGRGEYDYSTLEEFLMDVKPTGGNGGLKGVGSASFAANQTAVYTFFQDDLRLTPNLTLNLGVRYEYTGLFRDEQKQALNAISTVPGVIEFKKPQTDKNNFAPRFGFAYSPNFKGGIGRKIFGGTGEGSIRGGFGLSYDVLFGNLATLQLPPQFQQELDASAGNGGALGTATSFLQNGGLGNTPVPPNTVADARGATSAFIPDKITPYTMSYTLEIQRQFAKDFGITLRYLGTRGVKLNTQIRLNAGISPLATLGSLPTYLSASQVPDIKTRDGMLTLNTLLAARQGALGQFGFAGTVTAFEPIGSSTYNAGSIEVTRRFAKGYTVSANYTYAHNLDYGTNDLFTSLINPRRTQDGLFNFGTERGTSALNRTHRFVAYGIYEFPFGKNSSSKLVKNLIGGFQVSAVYQTESGQPFTAISGTDSNLNLDSAGDRAILNANGVKNTGSGVDAVRNSKGQVVGYVARNGNAQYIQAGAGAQSTVGNGTLRTPGINNWDITLFKNFTIREGIKLEFRTEMLNAFNHEQLTVGGRIGTNTAQATTPGFANVNSPTFNNPRIFIGNPRVINLGLKLTF